MDTKVNYTIVGVVAFLLLAVSIVLTFWLTTMKKGRHFSTYVTHFYQEVTGLDVQGTVRYNGIKVGYISDIEMDPKNLQDVIVYMRIKASVPITTSTVAVLESAGFTGGKYIGLKAKTKTAPPLKAQPGEKYPNIPSEKSLIADLESSLKQTTEEIKKVVQSLNELLDQQNRKAMKETLASVAKITETIAKNSDNIDKSLASVQHILENTSVASNQLPELVTQTRKTLQTFQETAKTFTTTGSKASSTLEYTSTTLQNINDQLMPSANDLLHQLTKMAYTFTHFGRELSENPSMIIRGKAPGAPGPGEH